MINIRNKKFDEIIDMVVKTEDDKRYMLNALSKIPLLSKCENITQGILEKAVFKIQYSYPVRMQWIMLFFDINDTPDMFKVDIKRTDTGEYIRSIYGLTMFELFAKCVIYMYCIGSKIDEY